MEDARILLNLGFGSAISTLTKQVLLYELLNPVCEECPRWSSKRKEENSNQKWLKWFQVV